MLRFGLPPTDEANGTEERATGKAAGGRGVETDERWSARSAWPPTHPIEAVWHYATVRDHRAGPVQIVAEVTREGALAAYTLAIVLVVSGVGFIGASSDELWRRCRRAADACDTSAAAAGLVTLCSIGAIVAGLGLFRRVRRRPVDPEGSSRFVIGLGVLFALGLLWIAWRIPAWTCDRGRFDPVLDLCMHPPTTSDPTSWALLKRATTLLGLAGGTVIAVSPRWVRFTAPLAVLAWAGGAGWFVIETLVAGGT